MRDLSNFIANFYYINDEKECKCFDFVPPEHYNTEWRLHFKSILTNWMNDDDHKTLAIDLNDCDAIIIKAPALIDQIRVYKIYYDLKSFEDDKPFMITHSYRGFSHFILSFLLSKYDDCKSKSTVTIPIHFHVDPNNPENNSIQIGDPK